MFGFSVPLATRQNLEPTSVVTVALFYAFLVVPVVSGLVELRPFRNLAVIFVL